MLNQHENQALATDVDARNRFHSLGENRFFGLNNYLAIKIAHLLKPSACESIEIHDRKLVYRNYGEQQTVPEPLRTSWYHFRNRRLTVSTVSRVVSNS